MFRFSSMSTSDYAYSPLPTHRGSKPHAPRRLALIYIVSGLSILVNVIGIVIVLVKVFTPPLVQSFIALDDFQQLNEISVIPYSSDASLRFPFPPLTESYNPAEHAVVSSMYTDDYTTAIMTLGHSIRAANVTARMVLMYIPVSEGGTVSAKSLCLAQAAGWTLHPVSFILPPANKVVSGHYRHQYTKLNLWKLDKIGIKSAVYIDADTLVRRNFDELFTLPWNFGAVPDVFDNVGFLVGINAGVIYFRPNSTTFDDMISKLSIARYPPNFAEQSFLNVYFGSQMTRLPFAYNSNLAIKLRSPTLWPALVSDMRIVHFTTLKPFPKALDLDVEEEEQFFEEKKQYLDGLWKDEVGWWREAYTSMRGSINVDHCPSSI